MGETDDVFNPGEIRKSFMGHLLELRMRIFVCLFFILGTTGASWAFWKEIAHYIRLPIDTYNAGAELEAQVELIITGPMEAFTSVLYIGLWAGIVLASPVLLWEVWRFVAPGLYRREKFAIVPILLMGPFLFATGAYFAYRMVLPLGIDYLLSFAPEIKVLVKLKLNEYMRFFLMIHVAFGFAFEMPLVILGLARLGVVTAGGLVRASRYVIAAAFILGAVLTPPDILTQSMMAGVLIVLYFGSVILAAIFGKKRPAPVDPDPDPATEADAELEGDAETEGHTETEGHAETEGDPGIEGDPEAEAVVENEEDLDPEAGLDSDSDSDADGVEDPHADMPPPQD